MLITPHLTTSPSSLHGTMSTCLISYTKEKNEKIESELGNQ